MEKGLFAGGCFWCIQAQFQRIKGVVSVASGYAGGQIDNPTYEQVKKGETGHYQVVEVVFDPKIITYEILLDIFFYIHDPERTDGQGQQDIGPQYLSAIFYYNQNQKQLSQNKIKQLQKQGLKIATHLHPFTKFYKAQDYHQNYWNLKGKQNPYCSVFPSKIKKMKEHFKQVANNDIQ